jgi:hypothetical protein
VPPADREAGPFPSHTRDLQTSATARRRAARGTACRGARRARLCERLADAFLPQIPALYSGGATLRGGWPRYHNFRYAYNSAALASGGHAARAGNIESGEVWIVRNLWIGPRQGWYAASYPGYPADYRFPGAGRVGKPVEHVLYADLAVRTVVGGTDTAPEAPGAAAGAVAR